MTVGNRRPLRTVSRSAVGRADVGIGPYGILFTWEIHISKAKEEDS